MEANEFNEWYKVGQLVRYTNDRGIEGMMVKTTSKAWDLCGTGVVKIEGKAGGVELDRIKVVECHKK